MTEEVYTHIYKYGLHKISSPGYSFYTDDYKNLYNHLNSSICNGCKEDPEFDGSVEGLLDNSCGCEYLLEENITIKEVSFKDE